MKWFKCFCDNHRGRTVNRLLDEVGHSGALIYYFIMELCAEKFEIERGAIASESDCIFTFNRRAIVSVARAKWPTVAHVLAIGAECTVWEWKANGNEIEIKFPMLLDLLDRDAKRPRKKRESLAQNTRLEEDKDKEEDKEQDKERASARARVILNQLQDNKIARQAMEHLNNASGKKYKTKTQYTDEMIDTLVNEGHTLEEIKKVIDIKTQQWKGTEMEKFLRPKTLFAIENFSGYLNEEEKKPFIYDINAELKRLKERDDERAKQS